MPSARAILRSPLTWILLGSLVVHGVGIGWGLPASDGWDNDGVAPRDFLPGIGATFSPGSFYTYPPVHLLLLAILTLPVSVVAVLRAPSFALADVVHEMLKVGYMTAMAGVARALALAMSLGIALHIARLVEELRADELGLAPSRGGVGTLRSSFDALPVRRIGWCAAAFVGANASLTYYAHTSNLDVPYLFWATWSALVFVRALVRQEPRLLRPALFLAALAVGTKDQASALFALAFPVAFGIWLLGAKTEGLRRRAMGEAARASGLAVLVLALVDGAVFNPSGFRARLAFLVGSASQDYVEYTRDWWGRIGLLVDAGRTFPMQYPSAFGAAILFGIASSFLVAFRAQPGKGERARRLAPRSLALLVVVSFTLMFNFSARRADPRFLLPQAVFFAVYGAFALEALVFSRRRIVRVAGRVVAIAGFALALHTCVSLDVNLLYDPRYEAEEWLAAHVQPGDVIETYGQNVYMPRMPASARVIRVGPEPIDKRNPMPGVEEVQAPFEDAEARPTKWIVLSAAWAWRYIIKLPPHAGAGRQLPPNHARTLTDSPAAAFFDRLVGNASPFAYAHVCEYSGRVFPVVDVHGTTGRTIWIYERRTALHGDRL